MRKKVYLMAISSVKERLKQSAADITTLNIDPACEDSCNYSKDYEYYVADVTYWNSVDDCDEEYYGCWTICSQYPYGSAARIACVTPCTTAFDNCMAEADAAWVATQEGIRTSIWDCIFNNCHD